MEENKVLLVEIANGLNAISWDILDMLNKKECMSYSEIKERLKVGQNKATKELARLEGGTLIKSKRDNIDARLLHFYLTENGIKILKYKK